MNTLKRELFSLMCYLSTTFIILALIPLRILQATFFILISSFISLKYLFTEHKLILPPTKEK